MKHISFIKEIDELAKKGDTQGIIKLYKENDFKDVNDSDFHYNLAQILDNSGCIKEAIKEYNLSIRYNPTRSEVHNRLGEIYLDKGEVELAIQQFCQSIEKGYSEKGVFLKLGKIYEQRQENGSAIELYKLAYEKTKDKLFLSLLANLQEEKTKSAAPEEYKEAEEISNIVCFLNLFSGRENVYARQWVKKDGQCGYL